MKKLFFLYLLLCISKYSLSQTILSGKVLDESTGEPLIGATIIYGKGKGTATDFDGNYTLNISPGDRSIKVSYVGYEPVEEIITVGTISQKKNFKLSTILLNEIQVVSDIARDRETPVAFSTIPIKKINEELASQDIPMVLNSN